MRMAGRWRWSRRALWALAGAVLASASASASASAAGAGGEAWQRPRVVCKDPGAGALELEIVAPPPARDEASGPATVTDKTVLAATVRGARDGAALVDEQWHVCFQILSLQFDWRPPTCLPHLEAREVNAANLPYGRHHLLAWLQRGPSVGAAQPVCSNSLVVRDFLVTPVLPATAATGARPPCRRRRPEQRRSDVPHADNALVIAVLVNRGGPSFHEAAASWHASGLLAEAREVIVYLQEWQHAVADSGSTIPHTEAHDGRVDRLPAELGLKVMGSATQQGIGPALNALVQRARGAEHVLFIEEDFAIVHDSDAARGRVAAARAALRAGEVDVFKLRHRTYPGVPFVPWHWIGHEQKILREETPYIANSSLLETVHWLHDPFVYFGEKEDLIWRCGEGAFCAFSTHAGWSNNPWIATPEWYLEHVAPAAAADWTRTVEGAVNHSPHLWADKCFVVAKGPGVFTHKDSDGRPVEEQSPSEDPFGQVVQARKAALRTARSALADACQAPDA